MKKKIKDLTEDERRIFFCEKYEDCSFCPLNDYNPEIEVEIDESNND